MLIRDHVPAYISWERFQATQRKPRGQPDQPRKLPGRATPGRSARWTDPLWTMRAAHADPLQRLEEHPWYGCQHAIAPTMEIRFARVYRESLSTTCCPTDSAGGTAGGPGERVWPRWPTSNVRGPKLMRQCALEARGEQTRTLIGHPGQYQRCEPENRLVAPRTGTPLGGNPERQQRQVARRVRGVEAVGSSPAVGAGSADHPGSWPRTLPAVLAGPKDDHRTSDRQQIARLLLERVTVIVDKESEPCWMYRCAGSADSKANTRSSGR